MKINCTKCGKLVAYVEKPSHIQSGASLYGACYECKNETLRDGGKSDFEKDFLGFLKGFAK